MKYLKSKRMLKRAIIIGVLLLGLLAVSWSVLAQTGDFDLPWFSVDGGGGTSSGGDFTLDATIGQPDASNALKGGDFALRGGFQAGVVDGVPPNILCVYDTIEPFGSIQRPEAINAVADFLLGRNNPILLRPPTRLEAIKVVGAFLLRKQFACP